MMPSSVSFISVAVKHSLGTLPPFSSAPSTAGWSAEGTSRKYSSGKAFLRMRL